MRPHANKLALSPYKGYYSPATFRRFPTSFTVRTYRVLKDLKHFSFRASSLLSYSRSLLKRCTENLSSRKIHREMPTIRYNRSISCDRSRIYPFSFAFFRAFHRNPIIVPPFLQRRLFDDRNGGKNKHSVKNGMSLLVELLLNRWNDSFKATKRSLTTPKNSEKVWYTNVGQFDPNTRVFFVAGKLTFSIF